MLTLPPFFFLLVPHPRSVQRVVTTLEMEVAAIMRGTFDHFMQKEIHEQPESLRQTMQGRVVPADAAHPDGRIKLGGISAFLPHIRQSRRLVFVACGSSFHGCLAARALFEEMAGIPVQLEVASDLLDRRCPLSRADTCFFVSQSGETADTLRALEYAKAAGALCVGVTNTVGSALARATDCGMHINAGAEIGCARGRRSARRVCLRHTLLVPTCWLFSHTRRHPPAPPAPPCPAAAPALRPPRRTRARSFRW